MRKQVNLGCYFKRYCVVYPSVVELTVIGKLLLDFQLFRE